MRQGELPRLRVESGAVPLALGAMLGAGVFMGLAPAAVAAGWWLLLGVPLALVTAACCAFAKAEQSLAYRGPDPAYACVRSRMGAIPARISASTQLVGLLAAMAAVARTVGEYLTPSSAPETAVIVIFLVVLGATGGLRIRGAASWIWLALTVVVLGVVVAVCFAIAPVSVGAQGGVTGVTGAAGVLFFAFVGFEHLAAPVREDERYSGRAVRLGLGVSLVVVAGVLLLVGVGLLSQLGAARLALSPAPVLDALGAAAAGGLRPLVGPAVAIVLLPVLLRALESSRSPALAAARDGDLPPALARAGNRDTPFLLDVAAGIVAAGISFLLEPGQAIPLAACCLLVHYAFATAGARLLLVEGPRWLMRSAYLGMGLSVILAMSMPVPVMLETLAVAVAGPLLAGLYSRRWR